MNNYVFNNDSVTNILMDNVKGSNTNGCFNRDGLGGNDLCCKNGTKKS